MNKNWSDEAWDDYMSWQSDKRIVKKINKLIKDIDRHPFSGIGKPEPLKYGLSGTWSRRITEEHRIVYEIKDDEIRIYSVRDHY
ncbi:Txe/YoeB family addiction module toxin (plasmid) [Ligilactobacillus salivarius]|nr:Txe/YoeB family addiction module toxin [Ligilactobacillus salivarius]MDF4191031.1 Txe/YoeB family addiction module toxin [Ligilactobacillus salivarius]OUQ32040.1 Txe/YoeB family addiction module toxin [Ligilactobacillus salivarius]OYP90598.1 Txe/YoeB family addiction module toxin [Ligilactobacillus salivarius]WHS05192.1 Txe/YoeB family addiction module toxin [Ligilactobacillus salivarius]WHS05210.1 Txe/YoeB family addiction module toxin [Ligilactobacillus salivarius]